MQGQMVFLWFYFLGMMTLAAPHLSRGLYTCEKDAVRFKCPSPASVRVRVLDVHGAFCFLSVEISICIEDPRLLEANCLSLPVNQQFTGPTLTHALLMGLDQIIWFCVL